MSKFKIGDKVKAKDISGETFYFYTHGHEFLGEVVVGIGTDVDGEFCVKILTSPQGGEGMCFNVLESHFVLADEVETFDYFSQTLDELVAENISLAVQIASLEGRLLSKKAFFEQNKREIKGRIKPAL